MVAPATALVVIKPSIRKRVGAAEETLDNMTVLTSCIQRPMERRTTLELSVQAEVIAYKLNLAALCALADRILAQQRYARLRRFAHCTKEIT
jgi:hypothetical protein